MYKNTKCTLYLFASGYKKTIVPCFVTQRSIYSASRTGLSYTESAFCMIERADLPKDTVFTGGKDFLVIGEDIKHLYPQTGLYPHEGLYPTNDLYQYTGKSNKALSDGIADLKKRGAVTVMMADFKDYGSKDMRHWELSCR